MIEQSRAKKGGEDLFVTIALAIIAIYAAVNWILWKLNFQAVLLYLMESGMKDIDSERIKKYREKVIKKHFKNVGNRRNREV